MKIASSCALCCVAPFAYRLFYPEDSRAPFFGGAEVQQYQLARALAYDKQFSVSFITGNLYRTWVSVPTEVREGVMVHKVFRLGRRIMGIDTALDFLSLYRALKNINPDVVLIRGGGVLAGKVALVTKIMLGRKFIFSSMHDRESAVGYWQSLGWYKRALFTYAVRHADAVICQHAAQQKAFKECFNREAVIMPTMYSLRPESEIAPREAREYILWVGRLEEWKQPELFIELARRYPAEKFVLITPSNAARRKAACAAESNIEIIGPIPFEAMDDYFRRAKVFVNTSRVEGFPNTFVQAAKNGTPILSFTVNPDSILETYGLGRLARGNQERLARDLGELLRDREVWQSASRNGYRYATHTHDSTTVVIRYKHLLLSLCA